MAIISAALTVCFGIALIIGAIDGFVAKNGIWKIQVFVGLFFIGLGIKILLVLCSH